MYVVFLAVFQIRFILIQIRGSASRDTDPDPGPNLNFFFLDFSLKE